MPQPGAVAFDYKTWTARYPEFVEVSETTATAYFAEATLYCANTISGPVTDTGVLLVLLNMVTAHIAALNWSGTVSGSNPLTPPGRVATAGEGSVSVSFDVSAEPGSKDWFYQTKYGAAYWQATLQYRKFRYAPGHAAFSRRSRLFF